MNGLIHAEETETYSTLVSLQIFILHIYSGPKLLNLSDTFTVNRGNYVFIYTRILHVIDVYFANQVSDVYKKGSNKTPGAELTCIFL